MITGNENAFPFAELFSDNLIDEEKGLTIRQHFAAMAMQGLLANNVYHNPNEKHKMITVQALSETAIIYADNLIAELNKEK